MSGQDHCADLRDFAHLVMRASSLEERSELACAMRRRAAALERQAAAAAPGRPGPAPEHRSARPGTVMVGKRRVTVQVRGRPRAAPYI